MAETASPGFVYTLGCKIDPLINYKKLKYLSALSQEY
jgi:hypothetical protein